MAEHGWFKAEQVAQRRRKQREQERKTEPFLVSDKRQEEARAVSHKTPRWVSGSPKLHTITLAKTTIEGKKDK